MSTYGSPETPGMQRNGIPGESDSLGVRAIGAGGRSSTSSNETHIILPFIAMPWDDGSHDMLRTGSIVFCGSNTKGQRNNLVEWNKLNDILRVGGRMYREKFGLDEKLHEKQSKNLRRIDGDSLTSNTSYSLDTTEDVRQLQKKLKDIGGLFPSAEHVAFINSEPHRLMSVDAEEEERNALMREIEVFKRVHADILKEDPKNLILETRFNLTEEDKLYSDLLRNLVDQRDTVGRYASVQSIRRFWNFLGVVNNTNEGKGVQTSNGEIVAMSGSMQSNTKVVNVIVQNHATTPNRWGSEVNQFTRLYAVLTRERKSDGTYGDYQIIPWSTNKQGETPPPSLLMHEDYYGHAAIGHWWYIGKVTHKNMGTSSNNTCRLACGLCPIGGSEAPSVGMAFTQLAKLETLEIYVAILQ